MCGRRRARSRVEGGEESRWARRTQSSERGEGQAKDAAASRDEKSFGKNVRILVQRSSQGRVDMGHIRLLSVISWLM